MGEIWQGLAVEHALTRFVRDSAALLDITHGARYRRALMRAAFYRFH